MKLVRINFEVPDDIRKKLKDKLREEGYTLKGFFLKHIYKWLKEKR